MLRSSVQSAEELSAYAEREWERANYSSNAQERFVRSSSSSAARSPETDSVKFSGSR